MNKPLTAISNPEKPKEFWINESEMGAGLSPDYWSRSQQKDVVHVIEYSAYEKVEDLYDSECGFREIAKAERDEAVKHRDAIADQWAELEVQNGKLKAALREALRLCDEGAPVWKNVEQILGEKLSRLSSEDK